MKRSVPGPTPDEVIAAIPGYTAAQRAKIGAALLALGKPTSADERPLEALHSAVSEVLSARGIAVWGLGTYRRHKHFKKQAPAIVAFVKNHGKPRNHAEERQLLKAMVDLVVKDLQRRGEQVDQTSVLWRLDKATALWEAAYPGYPGPAMRFILTKELP